MHQGGFFDADADKGDQDTLVQDGLFQWASGGGNEFKDSAQSLRANAEHSYQFVKQATAVRRLTPTECERLQGFPDGWTTGFADSVRYRMLGNAVAVPCVEWFARRVKSS